MCKFEFATVSSWMLSTLTKPSKTSSLLFLQVEILAGKDKGAIGKVSQVLRGQNKLFVEGLNCVSLIKCFTHIKAPQYVRAVKVLSTNWLQSYLHLLTTDILVYYFHFMR